VKPLVHESPVLPLSLHSSSKFTEILLRPDVTMYAHVYRAPRWAAGAPPRSSATVTSTAGFIIFHDSFITCTTRNSLLVQQEIHYLYNKKYAIYAHMHWTSWDSTGPESKRPGRRDKNLHETSDTRYFPDLLLCRPVDVQSQRYNCAPHDGSESASRANHWPLARKNRTTSLRPYDRKYTGLWSPGCKTSQRESTSCGVILRQSSCWYRSPFKI
jgi:hypothetical protein